MLLLQIVFACFTSCLLGICSSQGLSLVLIGSLLPNLENISVYYGNHTRRRGPLHSILFIFLLALLSFFFQDALLLAIGATSHVLIELCSKDARLMLFYPLKKRMNMPLFKQNSLSMYFLICIITFLLFRYINLETFLEIFYIYANSTINIILIIIDFIRNLLLKMFL